MTFDDVVKIRLRAPVKEYDPEEVRLMRAVGRGELTVDEAWAAICEHKRKAMKIETTDRGFEVCYWPDKGGLRCELQQSSGIDGNLPEAEFQTAMQQPGTSFVWLGYGSPAIGTRMHLDRAMVAELAARLQQWLATGSFVFAHERRE